MKDKILVPDFSTNGYTLQSARTKNDKGLCCHEYCNNKLENPPDTAYFGLKVCRKCRLNLDKVCQEITNEMNEEATDWAVRGISDALNVPIKIDWLYCPKCHWNMEAVGMKPECPDCKTRLHLLTGTKEEIDWLINNDKQRSK